MTASGRLSVANGRGCRAGLLAAACALGLHAILLSGLRWTWARTVVAPPRSAAVQVRAVAAVAIARASPPEEPPVAAKVVGARRAAATPRPAPAKAALATSGPALAASDPAREATLGPAVGGSLAEVTDDDPPPVYRTRLPPSALLRYDVGRGALAGTGELRWRRDADGYALDWQGQAGDIAVPTQSSRGGVDAAGVAPVRFVDQRASRPAAAVNFRRDLGQITFSRKAPSAALAPGAQDRLSWLVQLAAIVAAEPGLRERGREIRMAVAGAGGEVAVWRLRCEGLEALDGTAALHFLREPRGPYDTRAEVWLDPTGDRYWPVRAAWRSGPLDEGLELRLREAVAEE